MQEPSKIPRISTTQQQIQEKAQGSRDKGKAKMVKEEEPKEPTKIKDQKLYDKALKRVNTIVPMDTEKVEGSKVKAADSETRVEESSKRAGEELDRESIKKQKVEDETEQAELKECFEIIPFDEDAVNTIPLATKQAPIIDYKITKDARKIYYYITRAYGSDEMWRKQRRYLIKSWKLIDSCGVHCLMLESMYIYMLVRKEYPLAQFTYRRMWEGKLQVDYEGEMAFELLRFIKK
ncbi:hypothetical protein Tco_0554192 [Tanacetum coccineum]